MKKLVLLLLIVLGVAYFFGYEPTDLISALTPDNRPHPKGRRTSVATSEQASAAQPPQRSSTVSTVSANNSDGSLENRWGPSKP